MKRWQPSRRPKWFGFFGSRRTPLLPNVLAPGKPAAQVTDPLGKQAVSLLKAGSIKEHVTTLELTATFSLHDKQWHLSMQHGRKFPRPTVLYWGHGVPEGEGIFDPSQERTLDEEAKDTPGTRGH